MSLALIACLFILILISALLSASETALFSLSSLQLKHYKHAQNPRLKLIAHLMENPRDVLVTILMLNVLANLLVQNTVSSLFGETASWGLKVGLPLVLTLVFGEVLPKSMALPHNTQIAYVASPWVSRIARWLGPVRKKLTAITSWMSRGMFLFLKDSEEISAEELKHMLKTSEESGVLLPQERRLMAGALDLQEARVQERMRPRQEVLYYDVQEPVSKLVYLFVEQQITRVPVCDGGFQNVLGIVSARDYFLNPDLKAVLKKPLYVPETTRAFTLLQMLRERKLSLAMVVDEYGSISGLITQEDLIEGVVGEIADRRDPKRPYTRSSEDVIIASGKLELSEFQEIFGVELHSKENVVTLGGWLIEQLGDIPQVGAQYATDQFLFYVLAAEPNRVRRIYVRKLRLR
jgi:putative hemolysin